MTCTSLYEIPERLAKTSMKSFKQKKRSFWNKNLLHFFKNCFTFFKNMLCNSQKHVLYRLMYFQFENLNVLMCEKRNAAVEQQKVA